MFRINHTTTEVEKTEQGSIPPVKRKDRSENLFSQKHIQSKEDYDTLMLSLKTYTHDSLDNYYQFGYETLGPLLYAFAEWLYHDVKRKGLNRIFFFSRDGYILQRAFQERYGNEIENRYFYVSRRSLRVPQLWINPELDNVVMAFPNISMLSMRAFFKNLGLQYEDYEGLAHKHGFYPDDKIFRQNIASDANLTALYREIKNDVIANSKKEFGLLTQYMRQEGITGEAAVVDIGWRGSLQHFLENVARQAGIEVKLNGYYIGLISERWPDIEAKGFIRDSHKNEFCNSLKGSIGFFEFLFVAPEGSCEKYFLDGDTVRPILYNYEYEIDGKHTTEAKLACLIQEGAMQFVKDATAKGVSFDVDNGISYDRLKHVGLYPTKNACEMFGDIRVLEERPVGLATPQTLHTYMLHPKLFKEDFYQSKWKIGFLKRLLKIPLPYKKIYEFAKRIS